MNILFLLGFAIVLGFLGSFVFKKVKIPQVVGYIVIGVILGESFFKIFHLQLVDSLAPINSAALGFIGFMIGNELKLDIFKQFGKTIFTILLTESMGAYILVAISTYLLTGKLYVAILLAALSSATAPAATVDVLWEYKAKGILSTTILAIVGLDDALALIIYGFSAAIAKVLITNQKMVISTILLDPLMEISGAIALGVGIGFILSFLLKMCREPQHILVVSIASILMCTGIAKTFHLPQILANMFLGTTLANTTGRISTKAYQTIERFVPPVYILFFVLVGSRLQIALLPTMGWLGVIYVLARSIGKILGARFGAVISSAPAVVRKYLGASLFSQAGVAIGLAIAAYQEFAGFGAAGQKLGVLVINVITATTFIVQIIGPICVKWAIREAGEIPEELIGK